MSAPRRPFGLYGTRGGKSQVLGVMRPVTRLAEEIGLLGSQGQAWDEPVPEALQKGATQAWEYLQEVARQGEKERVLPRTSFAHRVFMATDAMNERGAALTWPVPAL